MRILKKIGWALLVLIVILVAAGGFYVYNARPDYEGEKSLEGLSESVKVHYDNYGIPHIYGSNEEDAFTALGYVHAQDRLWQMELLRRIGRGGISEVFGKDFIGTDKFFLALGIDEASRATIAELDTTNSSVKLAKAYLRGVNKFIEEGPTPIEFHLTGISKEKFALTDVYNTLGYMSFSFAMAHKTDPLLTKIRDSLGPEYLEDLQIHSDSSTLWIKNHHPDSAKTIKDLTLNIPSNSDTDVLRAERLKSKGENTVAEVMEALERLDIPLFEGSNSWVIAPEKTKNGKVIFANDPHIGFSQPSVWYEAHISTPTYEKYGYHLAGVPFPLLGHNRDLAYGMTMFENDDVDFYYEENHPSDSTKYKIGEGWADYESISKSIKVKDSATVDFTYRKTVHGPILTGIADQIDGERPISMWWAYTQLENQVMDALNEMAHAGNIGEFREALPKIHAPGLNIMYGDAEGNVAWWATAKLYAIPDSVCTKIVYDTDGGIAMDRKYLDFSQNPQSINPPSRYVYSANNQPDSIAGMLYPGYYLPENRARRIVNLLDAKDDWDAASVRDMMKDHTSPVNVEIVQNLLRAIDRGELTDEQTEFIDKLASWRGDYPLESVEGTIYHRWIHYMLINTFKDELGASLFDGFMTTHFVKRLIAPMSKNNNSVWWDDVSTAVIQETRKDIINTSLKQAWENLEENLGSDPKEWTWSRVHVLEHGHPMGQVEALRPYFNVGPFPVTGTREVISNMAFPYTENGRYEVSSGPSTRRVVDFSDVENSMSILPTGQSGNPFSAHYKDQAELYANGGFRKMKMNENEIKSTAKSVLTFHPKN